MSARNNNLSKAENGCRGNCGKKAQVLQTTKHITFSHIFILCFSTF